MRTALEFSRSRVKAIARSSKTGACAPSTRSARELEALGYLQMALQQPLGTGFSSAVKILS